jgi:uncharacterized GH25 family protein
MSRFSFALAAVLGFLSSAASGHEIKVFASRLTLPDGPGQTTVYLSWGHRMPVDDLLDAATLERYELLTPHGQTTPLQVVERSLQTNVVDLQDTGLHQIVVTRKPSVMTYVFDQDGERQLRRGPKTAITEGKIDTASRSLQCAKALVAVGPLSQEAPKPVGLPLEIVPLDAPAKWTAHSDLRFQIRLDGKPLPAAEIQARHLGFKPDDAWCYATESNRKGEFVVRPGQAGTWVVKGMVKKLTQGATRAQYDFESFTTTLTLEVQP